VTRGGAQALECISLVGMAVGRDKFRPDAATVMQFMQSQPTPDADDPTGNYMLQVGTCCVLRQPSGTEATTRMEAVMRPQPAAGADGPAGKYTLQVIGLLRKPRPEQPQHTCAAHSCSNVLSIIHVTQPQLDQHPSPDPAMHTPPLVFSMHRQQHGHKATHSHVHTTTE
jgi:hypothetical protein